MAFSEKVPMTKLKKELRYRYIKKNFLKMAIYETAGDLSFQDRPGAVESPPNYLSHHG